MLIGLAHQLHLGRTEDAIRHGVVEVVLFRLMLRVILWARRAPDISHRLLAAAAPVRQHRSESVHGDGTEAGRRAHLDRSGTRRGLTRIAPARRLAGVPTRAKGPAVSLCSGGTPGPVTPRSPRRRTRRGISLLHVCRACQERGRDAKSVSCAAAARRRIAATSACMRLASCWKRGSPRMPSKNGSRARIL
jgi:hypothetical protein